jgi:hypothetical protein
MKFDCINKWSRLWLSQLPIGGTKMIDAITVVGAVAIFAIVYRCKFKGTINIKGVSIEVKPRKNK